MLKMWELCIFGPVDTMFLSVVNTFIGSKCNRSKVSCTSVAFLLYKAQGLPPMVKSVAEI